MTNIKTPITRNFKDSGMATATLKILIDGDIATVVRTLPIGIDIAPSYWRNVSLTEAREIWDRQQRNVFSGWDVTSTTTKTGEMSA